MSPAPVRPGHPSAAEPRHAAFCLSPFAPPSPASPLGNDLEEHELPMGRAARKRKGFSVTTGELKYVFADVEDRPHRTIFKNKYIYIYILPWTPRGFILRHLRVHSYRTVNPCSCRPPCCGSARRLKRISYSPCNNHGLLGARASLLGTPTLLGSGQSPLEENTLPFGTRTST